MQGDIIEYINDVRVLSFKHASKQLKNAGESAKLRIKRHKSRLSLEDSEEFSPAVELEVWIWHSGKCHRELVRIILFIE